jgi:hypothetical protein
MRKSLKIVLGVAGVFVVVISALLLYIVLSPPVPPSPVEVTFKLVEVRENPATGYYDMVIEVEKIEPKLRNIYWGDFVADTGYRSLILMNQKDEGGYIMPMKEGDRRVISLTYPENLLIIYPPSFIALDKGVLGNLTVNLDPYISQDKKGDILETEAMEVARGVTIEGGDIRFSYLPEGWIKGEEGVVEAPPNSTEWLESFFGGKRGERFVTYWREEGGEVAEAVRVYIRKLRPGEDGNRLAKGYLPKKYSSTLFSLLYELEWMDRGSMSLRGKDAYYFKSYNSLDHCNFYTFEELFRVSRGLEPLIKSRCEALLDMVQVRGNYLVNIEVWSRFYARAPAFFPPHNVTYDGLRERLIINGEEVPILDEEFEISEGLGAISTEESVKRRYPSLKLREDFRLIRPIYQRIGADELSYLIAEYNNVGFAVEGWEQASFLFAPIDTPEEAADYVRFVVHETSNSWYGREHREVNEGELQKVLQDMREEAQKMGGELKILMEAPISHTVAREEAGGFIVERLYRKSLGKDRLIYAKYMVSKNGEVREMERYVCAESTVQGHYL